MLVQDGTYNGDLLEACNRESLHEFTAYTSCTYYEHISSKDLLGGRVIINHFEFVWFDHAKIGVNLKYLLLLNINFLMYKVQIAKHNSSVKPDMHNPYKVGRIIELTNEDGDMLMHMPYEAKKTTFGLNNLGNTCFYNAVMQCLAHCQPLLAYVLHG